MSEMSLLLVVIGMGVTTYGLRAGSLLLAERLPSWPWLGSFLRFVPVAVLSAIAAEATLIVNNRIDLSPLSNPRLLAAVLAIVVAGRTRRMLLTIAVGMIAFWILSSISF
jgi:branched-subunit amino acid transport protein